MKVEKIIPVSIAVFFTKTINQEIVCYMQERSPDLFEFPGGKIEGSETPLIALKREIKEEMNLDVNLNEVTFFSIYHSLQKDHLVLLYVYLIEETRLKENLFSLNKIPKTFEANEPIINDLKKYFVNPVEFYA